MSSKQGVWRAVLALCFAFAVSLPRGGAGEDYFSGPDLGPDPAGGYYDDFDEFSGSGSGLAPSPDYGYEAGPAVGDPRVEGPEAEGSMVTDIEVLNTVTTTPEQVRYRMSTRVGHPLNERTLDGDFQRLSAMGVFDDIQIKKEFVTGGVKIVVAVREKDIIRRIDFTGNKQIKNRKLNTLIESKVGERFDAGKGNRDRRAVEDFLHKEYYYFGEVEVDVEPYEDGVRLVFNVNEGGRLYVADIEFRGNTVFTRKFLLSKMETKRSGIISRGKYLRRAFERDLERIRMNYLDKGYLDARVIERPFQITDNTPTSRWQRRDVYINIDIEEGEQYRVGRVDFDFVSSSLAPEEKIRALISTRPGEVYSPITLQEDARKIRDVYGQAPNSRYFTRVMPEPQVTEEGLVMDVMFRIIESPEVMVEGVRITGLTHTKEVVVLREFELFPGEKVDSRKFNRSKENIDNLGYFREPNVEIREGSAPDRAILVAELEEIPTGRLTAGVGISSSDSIVGTVGLRQDNFDYKDWPKSFRDFYTGKGFRGAGQKFSANVSIGSYTQDISMNFTNPWIFGKPISMSITPYFSSYDYEDTYKDTRYGASIVFGKRLFDMKELVVSGGYKFEMAELSKIDNSKGYYPWEYYRQKGTHNVSRWLGGITWDSRDSAFEPTKGALVGADFEFAGRAAGSDKDFWKMFLTAQYLIPFFTDSQDRKWTLGMRADYQLAKAYGRGDGKVQGDGNNNGTDANTEYDYSKEVPHYERFYLGGVGSLRGYDYRGVSPRDYDFSGYNDPYAIGGESALTASVEAFFPIWDKIIRGSIFYDIGAVWRYGDSPNYASNWRKDHPAYAAISEAAAPGMGYVLDKEGLPVMSTDRKFRSSFGFGLHIKTPLGPMPVRLYYAFPLNKQKGDQTQRFQFSMGALF